ncbi:Signal recognition particle receptor subunit beta [Oopsacas minuta]|uniref:Signal recognition particle receptor subunit beta n=1 Tax=Oopsacas minuta TaxID=111878 RepID=A0AAV7JJ49_9METZ|nr:Signal recognition particle receptor subunit beta [Oopsacas minuta]
MDYTRFEEIITSNIYLVITSIMLMVLTILYYILRKSKPRSILLVGRSGAGKTRLLCKLFSNSCPITLTSIQPTTLEYTNPKSRNRSVFLVDIPGDGRIRSKYLNEHKTRRIVGILFLIDSVEFEDSKAEDLFPNVSCENIKIKLEKEMQMKISTQTFSPDGLDSKSKPQIIGNTNQEFSFKQLANKVNFVPSSITNEISENIPSIECIEDWLISKI